MPRKNKNNPKLDPEIIVKFLEEKGEEYWAGYKYRISHHDAGQHIYVYWQNIREEILTIFVGDISVFKAEDNKIIKNEDGEWKRRLLDKMEKFLKSYPKSKQHGMDLNKLVKFIGECINPNITVELGSYKGYSTILLGMITGKEVYAIDMWEDPEIFEEAEKNIAMARTHVGCDIHTVRQTFLKFFVDKNWHQYIDILHIDGDHRYTSVAEDFRVWSPFISPEGIILMHDVNNFVFSGPKKIMEENSSEWLTLMFPAQLGLGLLTKSPRVYMALKENFKEMIDVWQI